MICFCVGAQRTGSTLLTRMLNSHSEVAAPYEIPVPKFSLGTEQESLMLDKVMQICDLIGADAKEAIDQPLSFFSQILAFERKSILVAKEPANSFHLPRLRIEFGDVPLIHIVRDVRFVMESKALKSIQHTPQSIADMWYNHNHNIMKYKDLFSRYVRIRYEDLVSKPEEALTSLLSFLGLEYEAGMEEYWNFAHSDQKLKLWDRKSPEKSTWAQDIESGTINQSSIEPSKEVQSVYERLLVLQQYNAHFGYS